MIYPPNRFKHSKFRAKSSPKSPGSFNPSTLGKVLSCLIAILITCNIFTLYLLNQTIKSKSDCDNQGSLQAASFVTQHMKQIASQVNFDMHLYLKSNNNQILLLFVNLFCLSLHKQNLWHNSICFFFILFVYAVYDCDYLTKQINQQFF